MSATLWTVAHQAPLSLGFSKQEYWSGLPCPPPGDLPDPGMEPRSPALQADPFYHLSHQGSPNKEEGAPVCCKKEEEEGKMRKQSSTAALECNS